MPCPYQNQHYLIAGFNNRHSEYAISGKLSMASNLWQAISGKQSPASNLRQAISGKQSMASNLWQAEDKIENDVVKA